MDDRRFAIRGICLIASLSLILTALVISLAITRAPEPVYSGKTVDQWLNAGEEDACFALHEIGPAALPYIFAKLAKEDSIDGTSITHRRVWRLAPSVLRKVLPRPSISIFDQTRACTALMQLGPKTIPDLVPYLDSKNPAVRRVSAEALGQWRLRGKSIAIVNASLAKTLSDPDPRVRNLGAQALGLARGRAGE